MKKILLLLLVVVLLAGCGNKEDPEPIPESAPAQPEDIPAPQEYPEEPKEPEPAEPEEPEEILPVSREDKNLSSAVNNFNWKLFETQDPGINLFYSPFSLESALGMAALGAGEETKAELTTALCIDDYDVFCKDMSAFLALPASEKAKLTTANSLWISDALTMNPEYESEVKPAAENIFGAEIFSEDFAGDPKAAGNRISGWVKEKTEGLIPDYESAVTSDTVMDLINAVYFYGEWQKKFMEEDTYSEMFHGKQGERETDMMHIFDEDFRFVTQDGISAISLPYEDSELVMDILIPENKEGAGDITSLFSALDAEQKNALYKALDDQYESKIDELALPKFTMDITFEDLAGALGKLGIKDAFVSEGSKFPGFAENLYISDIAHRAKVEVDEKGSRAAAVTEMVMGVTSVMPEGEPVFFRADVPFIFTIRNRGENVILFTGRVNEVP